jgi:hypothetical protein
MRGPPWLEQTVDMHVLHAQLVPHHDGDHLAADGPHAQLGGHSDLTEPESFAVEDRPGLKRVRGRYRVPHPDVFVRIFHDAVERGMCFTGRHVARIRSAVAQALPEPR